MKMPIPWTISEIMAATGGTCLFSDCREFFPAIRIDSRKIETGDVFVAIKGPRFDGHDFVETVLGKKAGCVLINRGTEQRFSDQIFDKTGSCLIAVDDTVRALGDLASWRRQRTGVPVVAITGSTGKTTTREMTTAICRLRFETLSTSGNFNNEIGLPLTLFNLSPQHQLALLEIGMNHPGEIRRLSAICNPDIGVITNIGPAHLEGLKDIESVAMAKAELLENMRSDGVVVLNGDDPFGRKFKEMTANRVVMFGRGAEAQVRSENVRAENGRIQFELVIPGARVEIRLNVLGEFMIQNALAAAAVAHLLGIGHEDIKIGLESFCAVKGRMVVYENSRGVYVIDDTYNANPMSMEAAIRELTRLSGKKRGILVAGDMLELGDSAAYYHEQIGKIAAGANISRLYLTGEYAAQVAQGAMAAGMAGKDIFVGTKTDIVKDLIDWLKQGDCLLVKGSRSTGMEEIVAQMTTDARVCRPVSIT
jgi:UDP-N-acetylmuramoyl-tripeptide--D-alanyl-D-alanine ligase